MILKPTGNVGMWMNVNEMITKMAAINENTGTILNHEAIDNFVMESVGRTIAQLTTAHSSNPESCVTVRNNFENPVPYSMMYIIAMQNISTY